jgi:hypothetical protein
VEGIHGTCTALLDVRISRIKGKTDERSKNRLTGYWCLMSFASPTMLQYYYYPFDRNKTNSGNRDRFLLALNILALPFPVNFVTFTSHPVLGVSVPHYLQSGLQAPSLQASNEWMCNGE